MALAPDAASAKAAEGLAGDSKWVSLGADSDALWGECKGSGAKPYQTQVDLAALVARCSCPSRKFPCKHGLALLLLYAQKHPRLAQSERPQWVNEWLASRREKAEKKEQVASKPFDPAATAAAAGKREATRWKRIESGAADLQRWIADQFRRGLGKFGPEQRQEWIAMAARMVDAQAPGLGNQLQAALDAMNAGSGRYEEVIERLGLLQLLTEGVRRREQLSSTRLADLRTALGWPHDKDEVAASAEDIGDDWLVLGQIVQQRDEKLSERRTWVRGCNTGRYALLLDFAFNGKGLEGFWRNGAIHAATLKFYPGSAPLRALATGQSASQPQPQPQPWPQLSVHEAIEQASNWFAQNPWLPQAPLVLNQVTPMIEDEVFKLHTEAGALPLRVRASAAWTLLAFSGGLPIDVMGEWDGRRLLPLSAWRLGDSQHWALDNDGVAE